MEIGAPRDPTSRSPVSGISHPEASSAKIPARKPLVPKSSVSASLTTWLLRIAVALLAILGLAIRVWALGRHAINADQAVVGLMAEQILHGHFSAFYWGQSYGGGEPYVVALVFALFGQSTFSLGITPVLLDLIAVVLVWRIGRRMFGPTIAIEAALLFWIWPEVYIWQSTIEYGFRWFVLDLGLGATLLALRVIQGQARFRRWELFGIGIFLGAGWWGSPEIMYFVLPIVTYALYCMRFERLRIGLVELGLSIIGALVGASAWLEVNLGHHFVSLHSGVQPDPGFLHHLKIFVQHAVPLLLGLQLRISGRWLFGPTLGNTVNYLALVLAVVLLVVFFVRREALLLVFFCIFAPAIYAISPSTWYWADGRYAVFLAPATALLFVVGVHELFKVSVISEALGRSREILSRSVPVIFGLALTVAAITQLAPYRPDGIAQTGSATWTSWSSDPSSGFATVAAGLRRDGIHDLYAGYWVAYPLMFSSKNTIVASDISYVRNPVFLAELEHNTSTAWLFLNPKDNGLGVALTGVSVMDPACAALSDRCLLPTEFTRYLQQHKIGYRVYQVAPFIAIVPNRSVSTVAVSTTYRLRAAYPLPG